MEISDGDHLMEGSVHMDGNGFANSGYQLCAVSASSSAGEKALLTTSWLFMDKRVSFGSDQKGAHAVGVFDLPFSLE